LRHESRSRSRLRHASSRVQGRSADAPEGAALSFDRRLLQLAKPPANNDPQGCPIAAGRERPPLAVQSRRQMTPEIGRQQIEDGPCQGQAPRLGTARPAGESPPAGPTQGGPSWGARTIRTPARPATKASASGRRLSLQAQGSLGDPGAAANGEPCPATGALRLGHRQQATRLRSGEAARPQCLPQRPGRRPGDRPAAGGATAGPVRDLATGISMAETSCAFASGESAGFPYNHWRHIQRPRLDAATTI